MERQGESLSETETDEHRTPFAPLHNPVDSIYFDDRAFADAVDFGVLYSCVVPGSGNIIGGKAVIIRNFATNRADAVVSDYGFKAALGYNPRNTLHWKGSRLASLIVWDKDPFHLGAYPLAVLAEGRIVRDRR